MWNRKLSNFKEGQNAEQNKMKQKAKQAHTHCRNGYQICKTRELKNREKLRVTMQWVL